MVRYIVTMSIRTGCVVAMLFVQGWWIAVFAAGAILLPYVAVVLANVATNPRQQAVERPGSIVLRRDDDAPSAPEQPSDRPSDEDRS